MKHYNPVINDENKLVELNEQFQLAELAINKRIYNSQTDEKNRIIHLKETKVINGNLNDVAKVVQTISLNDMHPDLKLENVNPGTFFYSTKATDKMPVKVLEMNPEKIEILWFNHEGTKFRKTLLLKQISRERVKVTYFDYVKGMKTIFGLNEVHFKRLYLAKQSLAFYIQMNKVKIELTDDLEEKEKLGTKNELFLKKMKNKY